MDDELWTKSVVARALGVSEGTVLALWRRGELPAMRTSTGIRLYKRIDVERLRDRRP